MVRELWTLSEDRGDVDGVVASVETSDDAADEDRVKNDGRDTVSDAVKDGDGCPNAAKEVWSSSSALSIKILDRRRSELRVLDGSGGMATRLESGVCVTGCESGK